jgi:hypothetical protein
MRDNRYLPLVDEPANPDANVSLIDESHYRGGWIAYVRCDLPVKGGRWGESFRCKRARTAERGWLWVLAHASRMVREGAYVKPGKFVGERSMA